MEERVNAILIEKSFSDVITPEMKLQEDLGLDSLNMVELIVDLEDEFGIEIYESDLELENFQSAEKVYRLIRQYLGG